MVVVVVVVVVVACVVVVVVSPAEFWFMLLISIFSQLGSLLKYFSQHSSPDWKKS